MGITLFTVVLVMGVKGFKLRQRDHTWNGISTERYRSFLRRSARKSSSVPGDKGRDAGFNYTKTTDPLFTNHATVRRCTVQFTARTVTQTTNLQGC